MDTEWTQCAHVPRNTLFWYRARHVPNKTPSRECFMIFRVYRTNLGPPSQNRNWFFRRSISLALFSSQLRNQLVQLQRRLSLLFKVLELRWKEVIFAWRSCASSCLENYAAERHLQCFHSFSMRTTSERQCLQWTSSLVRHMSQTIASFANRL